MTAGRRLPRPLAAPGYAQRSHCLPLEPVALFTCPFICPPIAQSACESRYVQLFYTIDWQDYQPGFDDIPDKFIELSEFPL